MSSNRYAPRVAGISFLFLIATVMASGLLWGGVGTTQGISETLASISANSASLRISIVLTAVAGITTLVLAAMLHATVRHQDRSLAILALCCRAVEGGLYSVGMFVTLALLSLSHGSATDTPSAQTLAGLLIDVRWMGTNVGAIFFAAGSTLFTYLLLRARSIPVPLSAVGVVGSLLVLIGVPVQTALSIHTFAGPSALIWAPIGIFEITAGVWLIAKGAKMPTTEPTGHEAARV